jgi:transposase-like protein
LFYARKNLKAHNNVCKLSEIGSMQSPKKKNHICSNCGKGCVSEYNLKKHIRTQHTNIDDKKPVTMKSYSKELKDEVAKYALENSVEEAKDKFIVPGGTIRRWVKLLTNPQICTECGVAFASVMELRKHIEVNHKSVPYQHGKISFVESTHL